MRWEERLLDLFDDLEQQAEGLALAERDALVAEQSRAEYAEVDLAARLPAPWAAGCWLDVQGVGGLDGGAAPGRRRLVPARRRAAGAGSSCLPAVRRAAGTRRRGRGRRRPDRSPHGWGSRRRCAAWRRPGRSACCTARTGQVLRAVLGRVGRDFVEVPSGETGRSRWCRSGARGDAPALRAGLTAGVSPGRSGCRSCLGVGLGVHPLDVLLELDGLDAVLLAAADLDVAQLAGLHERPHLRHGGGQDLRDVGERQEPRGRVAALGAGHGATMPAFAGVSLSPTRVWLWTTQVSNPDEPSMMSAHASTGARHRCTLAWHFARTTGLTAATRATRSRWRDPRLVVGVAVVAACALLGATGCSAAPTTRSACGRRAGR